MYWSNVSDALWDPFTEMRRMQREVNRLFRTRGVGADAWPPVNLYGNEAQLVLTAELPGVDPAGLRIQIEGRELVLGGERKTDEVPESATVHRSERAAGAFERRFRLPFEVEVDAVKATSRHGVLHVTLPRAEATKPKAIAVEAS